MIKSTRNFAPAQPQFVRPSLRGIQPPSAKTKRLNLGEYLVHIEKVKPVVTYLTKDNAIIPEFTVLAIRNQVEEPPYKGVSNGLREVGELCSHYFAFGGPYQYGEQEYLAFMLACGAPNPNDGDKAEAEFDVFEADALGEKNSLEGTIIAVKRTLEVSGKGKQFVQVVFSPYVEADWVNELAA